MLLLLGALNVDPRIRAGWRYARPPARYVVPVAGVAPHRVRSSWGARRPGGRTHEGVDILAPRGTAVVATTDGVVWKVGTNTLGGKCVWILGEGLAVHYYAHLDDWAYGLAAGRQVRAGEILGTVGTTGNARGGAPHLHFGITELSIFGPRAVDPAPRLRAGVVAAMD